ncbi:MAG TPA: preprotein translocase subunit SecE [bacterium]|uniref:Preprotein translocase subunit SecE n=1 Tax=candidate division TA06 bacterium ADurb.Bin417 TaxID=1852828 RepID=A0A1V5MKG6_UNCT6|nr:MAG: preprotein translocase subunit SecE [candidate division TA06 bacterium ADurb.Bin417]HNQ35838.1 preprotein translocase subunit SecE [bacterium]HNS48934.1 preprotein translocase subunit SecE [bacterium]
MEKLILRLRVYFDGVKSEFRKISWPQRKALEQLTAFVLFLVLILALFAGILDEFFSRLIRLILG